MKAANKHQRQERSLRQVACDLLVPEIQKALGHWPSQCWLQYTICIRYKHVSGCPVFISGFLNKNGGKGEEGERIKTGLCKRVYMGHYNLGLERLAWVVY